ncbi:hypothetical protein [Oscillibacter sp. 1-3]|uniref:hypothetical protein n=1 Tax=Oscillibacter sp. 1-3 TaxID=1235797 RepID=UPI0003373C6E|nr:hypothetical protein [Oscillibacter sp. 1-3]EOS65409.1 hypothetical protein C816_02193 [Oscillibacter sp. 1-3]
MFMFLFRKDPRLPPDRHAERDLPKEALQALLTEYSSLREEAQHDDTHQIQLVTITFSTLAAAAGAAAALFSEVPEKTSVFFAFVVLPCLAMFMGLLWIDLIYRRTRFGCYTRLLEDKINALLQPNAQPPQQFMAWEHWLQALEEESGSFGQTRFFRGCIVTGSWVAAPFLIMAAYFLLEDGPFFAALERVHGICRTYWPVTIFMLAVYAIYFSLYFMFVRRILQFPSRDA